MSAESMARRDEAIRLIRELVDIEVQLMKEMYTRRGETKKSKREEWKAVRQVFFAITGSIPAEEEMERMVGG
jgi:hypothetical protein